MSLNRNERVTPDKVREYIRRNRRITDADEDAVGHRNAVPGVPIGYNNNQKRGMTP